MLKWLGIIARTLGSLIRTERDLALENLALRQQLAVLKHRHRRPRFTKADRWFWALLSRIWSGWQECLHIVQPETIVRWHRQGFRYYWRWKSRSRGRPKIDPEIRYSDSALVSGESVMGRASNPRRIAQARDRDLRDHSVQVHSQAPWTSVSVLASFPSEPR